MIEFEPMHSGHWPAVKAIYEEGIKTGNATFETAAPEWEAWNNGHVKACRIVAK
jgi:L-amino acid N-acyltransferase YncA